MKFTMEENIYTKKKWFKKTTKTLFTFRKATLKVKALCCMLNYSVISKYEFKKESVWCSIFFFFKEPQAPKN